MGPKLSLAEQTKHEVIKAFEDLATELKLRGFSDRTVETYVACNMRFLRFIRAQKGRSGYQSTLTDSHDDAFVKQLTTKDIKSYLAYLITDKKLKSSSINLILSSLKFYYEEMHHLHIFDDVKHPKSDKKLPIVLSKAEIRALLESIRNKKHKVLVSLLYGSGMRVSEVVTLQVQDLDLVQGIVMVRSGKGKKDRQVILPKKLIKKIEMYLKKAKITNSFVFPYKEGHISTRQAQNVVKSASQKAGIQKKVSCHTLRSSFATHLLEGGTDIRIIQELLGHANLSTTQIYTQVSLQQIKQVKSPLDTF